MIIIFLKSRAIIEKILTLRLLIKHLERHRIIVLFSWSYLLPRSCQGELLLNHFLVNLDWCFLDSFSWLWCSLTRLLDSLSLALIEELKDFCQFSFASIVQVLSQSCWLMPHSWSTLCLVPKVSLSEVFCRLVNCIVIVKSMLLGLFNISSWTSSTLRWGGMIFRYFFVCIF